MNKIVLRKNQSSFFNKIIEALKTAKSVCAVLPTGGGKSVVIGYLANQLPGRTLILTHRTEILQQNSKWIEGCGTLTSKNMSVGHKDRIVIAMVETLSSRIKKYGHMYLGDFDNIILDEAHTLVFEKVYSKYNYSKLIGFTATPIINKKKTFIIDEVEYVRNEVMGDYFDVLVQGDDVQDLIDSGNLCQDYNVKLQISNLDRLKKNNSISGYTNDSLNLVYNNSASMDVLWKSYEEYCIGKKTIIFNATSEVNLRCFEFFKSKKVNCLFYDSVNKDSIQINEKTGVRFTRQEIIEYYRNEKDCVLIGVNVFTTGFDVEDIECVIMNRKITSLSLYLQCVGRGSRTTEKIIKHYFTFIDLGQNIEDHGIWSERRDWNDFFKPKELKLKKKRDLMNTWDCENCGFINIVGELNCEGCGSLKTIIQNNKKDKEGVLQQVNKFPIPKGNQIVQYCISQKKDTAFAFRLSQKKIIDLVRHHKIKKDFYERNRDRLNKRIEDIFRKIYFAIIRSELEGGRRKLSTLTNQLKNKIENEFI